jgi:hypothetical protein
MSYQPSDDIYTLRVHEPMESGAAFLYSYDINARREDLRFTTRIDAGFEGLEAGISTLGYAPVGELEAMRDLPFFAHVELWKGSDTMLWEGRAGWRDYGNGNRVRAFRAHGYVSALGDDWVRSNTELALSGGEAIRTAIELYAPYLRIGNDSQFVLPTVTLARGWVTLYKLAPGYVIDMITKMGDVSNQKMDLQVWQGRVVWMQPRTAPDVAHYNTDFDERYVRWSEDPAEMASEITVEYTLTVTAGDGTKTITVPLTSSAENTAFYPRHRFTKKRLIAGGEMDATSAAALRDRELASRSEPAVQATIFLSAGAGTLDRLQAPGGAVAVWDEMRAGRWARVGNKPKQPVVGATIDLNGKSVTLELGMFDPRLPKNYIREGRDLWTRFVNMVAAAGGRTR